MSRYSGEWRTDLPPTPNRDDSPCPHPCPTKRGQMLPATESSAEVITLLSNGARIMNRLVRSDAAPESPRWYYSHALVRTWTDVPPAPGTAESGRLDGATVEETCRELGSRPEFGLAVVRALLTDLTSDPVLLELWARRYCELAGVCPDGIQVTLGRDGPVEITMLERESRVAVLMAMAFPESYPASPR